MQDGRPGARRYGHRDEREGIFSLASWIRLSPKSRRPAAKASRMAGGSTILVTATRVTSEGKRPAREAARLCAS